MTELSSSTFALSDDTDTSFYEIMRALAWLELPHYIVLGVIVAVCMLFLFLLLLAGDRLGQAQLEQDEALSRHRMAQFHQELKEDHRP